MSESKKFMKGFALSVAGGVLSGLVVTYLRDNNVDFGLMKKQTKSI